jgi:hypothetical protein
MNKRATQVAGWHGLAKRATFRHVPGNALHGDC